ncbi:MAG TPA: 16S rRNA (guanine(527)-N(7))-methyltransferase RsmG [Pyrinomonadaceae bacterium]|jgi:16S rRNA (guanine527-N7)-methyltransferase|nr:16S rRNA (guanine(527)-N(7))-methyltransferase RsmG [Pyrinomonadaceae bacterium]
MRKEFINAIKSHQSTFRIDLQDPVIERLADYYELVQEHNPLLHLVGPCSAEKFATRHILESLTLLEHLPEKARFADVGAGAGLPSIPCLIAREDLSAVLIESKEKKVRFLQTVFAKCELQNRTEAISSQFSEYKKPIDISYVTCRALDKFQKNLPALIKWSRNCPLLFFGGNSLRDELRKNGVDADEKLMPMSGQRFLFIGKRR